MLVYFSTATKRCSRGVLWSIIAPPFIPVEDGDLFAVQPEQQLEQQEAVDQVMQRVRGKKELEELVSAISESNGGPCPNQELAADLGVTVSEVVNRKKRIRRSFETDSPQPPKPRKEPQVR